MLKIFLIVLRTLAFSAVCWWAYATIPFASLWQGSMAWLGDALNPVFSHPIWELAWVCLLSVWVIIKGFWEFSGFAAFILVLVILPFWAWALNLAGYLLGTAIVSLRWLPVLAFGAIGIPLRIAEVCCGFPLLGRQSLAIAGSLVPGAKAACISWGHTVCDCIEEQQKVAEKRWDEEKATAMVLGMSTINRNLEELRDEMRRSA
jgi:hypothetical protein